MKVIVFGSLKGGTGKSSFSVMTARCLAASGFKVLLCDFDINNSSSFVFTPENIDEIDPKNKMHLAAALQSDNILDYAVKTDVDNIDLIRSSLYLVDLRTIPINRFKKLVSAIPEGTYDFIICDTAPTYDSLVLTAYEAADEVITPVQLSQFDFNTSLFLKNKFIEETHVGDRWKLLLNGYHPEYEKYENSKQQDYINLFSEWFDNILETKMIQSSQLRSCIDRNELLGTSEKNAKLHSNIISLCSEITGMKIVPKKAF